MCELTFCHFGNKKLNQLYLHQQFLANTEISNKDGFGVFSKGNELEKAGFSAQICINFGVFFNRTVSENPTIGHVRLATAVGNIKTVDKETAHPFENERFVLAHNGVLDLKKYEKTEHKVDTLIFLEKLTELSKANAVPDSIIKAMELFHGTFAFLIYDKQEDKFYIVRGKTKKLHFSEVTVHNGEEKTVGLVINTDKLHLETGLNRFKAIVELSVADYVEYTKPQEITEETIFEYDLENKAFFKVGDVKESEKPKANFFPENRYGNQTNTGGVVIINDIQGENVLAKVEVQLALKIDEVLSKLGISLYELDEMIQETYDNSLVSFDAIDLMDILDSFLKGFLGRIDPKSKALWQKTIDYFGNNVFLYNATKLDFPYFMNRRKEIIRALEKFTDENKIKL